MKRLGSLLLAAISCLFLLPVQIHAISLNMSDQLTPNQAISYYDVLANHIKSYGVYPGPKILTEAKGEGLAYAELIDFDGDSNFELYDFYITCDTDDQYYPFSVYEEIWSFTGDKATLVYEQRYHNNGSHVGDTLRRLCTQDGKTYLIENFEYGSCPHFSSIHISELQGGHIEEVLSVTEEVDALEALQGKCTTASGTCKIVRNGIVDVLVNDELPWSLDKSDSDIHTQEYLNEYNQYNIDSLPILIDASPYMVTSCVTNDVSELLAVLSQYISPEEHFKVILTKIPYIGDVTKCQMTYEQVTAYQKVLEDIQTKYHTPLTENERSSIEIGYDYAFLFDIIEDGIPLLYVNYWSEADSVWIAEVWCYDKGKAIKLLSEKNTGQAGAWDPESLDLRIYKELNTSYLFLSNNDIGIESRSGERTTKIYIYEPGKLHVLHSLDEKYGNGYLTEPGWFTYESYVDEFEWGYATFDGEPLSSMEQVISIREQLDYHDEDTMYLNGWDTFIPIPDLIDLLSQIIPPAPTTSYPYALGTLTDEQISAIAKTLADQLGGEVTGVYKLADDLYYVVVTLTGGGYGGAVVKETRSGFRVLRAQETPIDDAELAPLAAEAATSPNLTVDYGPTADFTAADEYIQYLGQLLDSVDGTAPNDPAKAELSAYAESAVSRLSGTAVRASRNRITLTGKDIEQAAADAGQARDQFSAALDGSGVALNKPITILLRVEGQNLDLEKPVRVTLDPTVADALGDVAALQLLLGDGRHSVKLTAGSLHRLISDYGAVTIQLTRSEGGVYAVAFAGADGEALDKLPTDVTFTLPAESALATVLASYQGGSDNWGGQYDAVNHALEFSTKYSGQYEVMENDQPISDLDGCSDEVQSAVRFMVSKGYFDLTDGAFAPGDDITRYDFTAALVKMFFALDRDLTASFPDVPDNSPYYPYVASAEHGAIVNGYDDGTFSGGDSITGEQVLALCARTLAQRKGYLYPETPEDYLTFPGGADTSPWAAQAVALAGREGLIPDGEAFAPPHPMSRAQSAQALYRLFMLLYETSPVALEVSPAEAGFPVVPAVAGAAVILAGGGCAFLFLRKKKAPTA